MYLHLLGVLFCDLNWYKLNLWMNLGPAMKLHKAETIELCSRKKNERKN